MTQDVSRQLLLIGLTATLAALALSSSAWAATASVIDVKTPFEDDPGAFDATKTPALVAAPGESNRVTVSAQTNPATVLFEDLGAVITVGAGCVSIDAHHARCTNEASALPIVNAGDLNDAVTSAPGAGVAANGGSGSDTLTGADKGDALDGGGGAGDLLAGGGDDDNLRDGDAISGSATDADKLDGGAGHDTISYERRSAAVSVILSDALPDGQGSEGDLLSSVEDITGGKGADRLAGTPGRNVVQGGPGADVITAGNGPDRLYGGKGNDRIEAGAGNDRVYPEDGDDRVSLGSGNDRVDETYDSSPTGNDRIVCGSGSDEIQAIQDKSIDSLARDCERFNATETAADGNFVFNGLGITAQLLGVRRSDGALLVPIRCSRQKKDKACVVSGELRAPSGLRLGGPLARLTVRSSTTRTLRMALTSAGMSRVRRGATVRLLISEHSRNPGFEQLARARSRARVVVHG